MVIRFDSASLEWTGPILGPPFLRLCSHFDLIYANDANANRVKRAPLDISLSLEADARGLFAVQVEEEEVKRKRIKKKKETQLAAAMLMRWH